MQNHVCGAPGARGGPSAGFAGEYRRIAAAVDEDQALLAELPAPPDSREQASGEAGIDALGSHVDHADGRQPRAGRGALGKLEALVSPRAPVVPGLERRRGGPEDHRTSGEARPVDRGVACRVAQALLLLERRAVLFVADDPP